MNIFQHVDALLTFLVAVASSATTLLVTKIQSEKDVDINDRNSLSEDEKAFRKELRDTIESYKLELKEARLEITELRQEIGKLHQINLKLTLENKQLNAKVDELVSQIERLNSK